VLMAIPPTLLRQDAACKCPGGLSIFFGGKWVLSCGFEGPELAARRPAF